MALRPLVILPDAQLRLVSKPVETVTPAIRTLVDDMFETMYDARASAWLRSRSGSRSGS